MPPISDDLRQQRERLGVSLDTITEVTRIAPAPPPRPRSASTPSNPAGQSRSPPEFAQLAAKAGAPAEAGAPGRPGI